MNIIIILASQDGSSNQPPSLFSDDGGYYIFPNGLILQWGRTPVTKDALSPKSFFPIPFPNKCLSLTGMIYAPGEADLDHSRGDDNIYAIDNTSFVFAHGHDLSGVFWWMAVGY